MGRLFEFSALDFVGTCRNDQLILEMHEFTLEFVILFLFSAHLVDMMHFSVFQLSQFLVYDLYFKPL